MKKNDLFIQKRVYDQWNKIIGKHGQNEVVNLTNKSDTKHCSSIVVSMLEATNTN